MTQDEIIEMARESGMELYGLGKDRARFVYHLVAFTNLVAAKEREALAQPEQEPAAWVSEDVCEGQYIDGRPRKIWWECEKGVGTAFYTTPPQRTWVGLTVNEIALINADYPLPQGFAQAIEAKLKEKNT